MIILWYKDSHMFVTDSTGLHYRAACLARLKIHNDIAENIGLGRPYVWASNQDGTPYHLRKIKPAIKLKNFAAWE